MAFCSSYAILLKYLFKNSLKKSVYYPHFMEENSLIFGAPLFTLQQSDQIGKTTGNKI